MLILLSLFSWLISLLITTPLVRDGLATIGWIFLSLGIGWATVNIKFSILGFKVYPGPWLTAGMVLGLIYAWNLISLEATMVLWPMTTAAIATVPLYLAPGPKLRIPKVGDRQTIVVVGLSHALISCWIGFFLVVQTWLQAYPSTLADSFESSAFVVKLSFDVVGDTRRPATGVRLLEAAENELRQQLEPGSWNDAVRWLMNNNNEFKQLQDQVLQQVRQASAAEDTLSRSREQELWNFGTTLPRPLPSTANGYAITFRAYWYGPSSNLGGFRLSQTCELIERGEAERLDPDRTNPFRELPNLLTEDPENRSDVVIRCEPISPIEYPDANAP
ncbi:MAG: hypothetical protein EA367_05555 [Leptolyngbya sp. DLM2.Bin15]|nr:MAG: hypothetical protein EA367_05555 [Leptolyngbya sp. DLM2.Bin15]